MVITSLQSVGPRTNLTTKRTSCLLRVLSFGHKLSLIIHELKPLAMLNFRILNYYGLNHINLANNVYLCNRYRHLFIIN